MEGLKASSRALGILCGVVLSLSSAWIAIPSNVNHKSEVCIFPHHKTILSPQKKYISSRVIVSLSPKEITELDQLSSKLLNKYSPASSSESQAPVRTSSRTASRQSNVIVNSKSKAITPRSESKSKEILASKSVEPVTASGEKYSITVDFSLVEATLAGVVILGAIIVQALVSVFGKKKEKDLQEVTSIQKEPDVASPTMRNTNAVDANSQVPLQTSNVNNRLQPSRASATNGPQSQTASPNPATKDTKKRGEIKLADISTSNQNGKKNYYDNDNENNSRIVGNTADSNVSNGDNNDPYDYSSTTRVVVPNDTDSENEKRSRYSRRSSRRKRRGFFNRLMDALHGDEDEEEFQSANEEEYTPGFYKNKSKQVNENGKEEQENGPGPMGFLQAICKRIRDLDDL